MEKREGTLSDFFLSENFLCFLGLALVVLCTPFAIPCSDAVLNLVLESSKDSPELFLNRLFPQTKISKTCFSSSHPYPGDPASQS